jgi:PHD/YefM family antitoxin component YafN of YafNO toxin-antitoxin module
MIAFMYTLFMNQAISTTQARKDLLRLVDEVDQNYSRIDLTKNGRIRATLVSPDYLDSLEETVYSLDNSLGDIIEAEQEITAGQFVTLNEIKKRLNK